MKRKDLLFILIMIFWMSLDILTGFVFGWSDIVFTNIGAMILLTATVIVQKTTKFGNWLELPWK